MNIASFYCIAESRKFSKSMYNDYEQLNEIPKFTTKTFLK